jgi:hypothetical protein
MCRNNRILTLLQNTLDLILIPFWTFIGLTIFFGYFMPDRILTAVMCFILTVDTWIIHVFKKR